MSPFYNSVSRVRRTDAHIPMLSSRSNNATAVSSAADRQRGCLTSTHMRHAGQSYVWKATLLALTKSNTTSVHHSCTKGTLLTIRLVQSWISHRDQAPARLGFTVSLFTILCQAHCPSLHTSSPTTNHCCYPYMIFHNHHSTSLTTTWSR